jgi:hypothetical protein
VDKQIVVPAGDEIDVIKVVKEAGKLLYAFVDSPSPDIQVLMQLDDQPEPLAFISIQELYDLGLDEKISYFWWNSRYVKAPIPIYTAAYTNDDPEPYYKQLRFRIRNPTATDITLNRIDLKRIVDSQGAIQ